MNIKKVAVLMLCLIFVFILFGCDYDIVNDKVTETNKTQSSKPQNSSVQTSKKKSNEGTLIIKSYSQDYSNGYIIITGHVLNNSNRTVSYYEVLCKFKNYDGQVIASTFTNNSISTPVQPGEMQRFELMHPVDLTYYSFSLSIQNIIYK